MKKLFDLETWKKIQDMISKNLEYPLITIVDNSVFHLSGKIPFIYELILSRKKDFLTQFHKNNEIETVDFYAGIKHISLPININKERLGYIIIPGIKTDELTEKEFSRDCTYLASALNIEQDEFVDTLSKIKPINKETLSLLEKSLKFSAEMLVKLSYEEKIKCKKRFIMEILHNLHSSLDAHDFKSIGINLSSFIVKLFQTENCAVSFPDHGRYVCYPNLHINACIESEKIIEKLIMNTRNVSIVASLKNDYMLKDIREIEFCDYALYSLPLVHDSKLVAFLHIYLKENTQFEEKDILDEIIKSASRIIHNATSFKDVKNTAFTDKLTNLYNRHYFKVALETEIENAKEKNNPTSLIISDIDNFKYFNDNFGHPEGDVILEKIAGLIKENIRDQDVACRYGGEEFVIILPNTKPIDARELAENIRRLIESHKFDRVEKEKNITISLGLTSCLNSTMTYKEMLEEADKNLYKAKRNGKNQVISSVCVDRNINPLEIEN